MSTCPNVFHVDHSKTQENRKCCAVLNLVIVLVLMNMLVPSSRSADPLLTYFFVVKPVCLGMAAFAKRKETCAFPRINIDDLRLQSRKLTVAS